MMKNRKDAEEINQETKKVLEKESVSDRGAHYDMDGASYDLRGGVVIAGNEPLKCSMPELQPPYGPLVTPSVTAAACDEYEVFLCPVIFGRSKKIWPIWRT